MVLIFFAGAGSICLPVKNHIFAPGALNQLVQNNFRVYNMDLFKNPVFMSLNETIIPFF